MNPTMGEVSNYRSMDTSSSMSPKKGTTAVAGCCYCFPPHFMKPLR